MLAFMMDVHVKSVVLLWVCDERNLRAVGTCYADFFVERCGTLRVAGMCYADVIVERCGNSFEICRHDGEILH